jgi:hypothetical protein
LFYFLLKSSTYVNECFHDFMFVNRSPHPASVNLVLQHGGKPCNVSIALFVDYSYYSSLIPGLFVLFIDYSRTIRTIRRLFVLFVDYSPTIRTIRRLFADYSSTIRTIRFTILVLSIAVLNVLSRCSNVSARFVKRHYFAVQTNWLLRVNMHVWPAHLWGVISAKPICTAICSCIGGTERVQIHPSSWLNLIKESIEVSNSRSVRFDTKLLIFKFLSKFAKIECSHGS